MSDKFERDFHQNRRRVNKNLSKPVEWNGKIFKSARALGMQLKKFYDVSSYVRNKRKLEGFVPKYINKEGENYHEKS